MSKLKDNRLRRSKKLELKFTSVKGIDYVFLEAISIFMRK